MAQQPGSNPSAAETDESVQAMKKRLKELEHLVQQLSPSTLQQGQTPPKHRRVASSPDQPDPGVNLSEGVFANASSTSSEHGTLRSSVADTGSTTSTSQHGALHNAPLVHLLRRSQLISPDAPVRVEDTLKPFMVESRVTSICEAALALMPRTQHMDMILEWTMQYWPTWPPCQDCTSPPALLGPGMVTEAKDMILRGLSSTSPGFAAKTLGWLALCIQQASRDIVGRVRLAMPQADLVNMYLNLIQSLLEIDDSAGGSVDSVACMNICYKLYINMGRPQKAWYWTRRSVLTAVNLGLHQRKGTPEAYESILWATSWMCERVIAHILGLPSSVSSVHAGISLDDVGTSDDEQIMWHLATAVGKIIERDQMSSSKSQYAMTVQISQELEEVKELIPAAWWLPSSSQQIPIAELFARQRAKVLYFIHLKLLHLPYMMRSVGEPKYRHSWDVAMDASRGGVEAYTVFREAKHGDADLCQLMDFQAFSSAMVLVIGHMICPDRATDDIRDGDWRRIDAVMLCLRRTLLTLECPVASQALRTLEVVNSVRLGDYMSQDEYTIVIPYFGKVSISPRVAAGGSTDTESLTAPSTLQTAPSVVEFSTNEFIHGSSWLMDKELELEADWTDLSALEPDMDWSQVFISSQ